MNAPPKPIPPEMRILREGHLPIPESLYLKWKALPWWKRLFSYPKEGRLNYKEEK